MNPYEILELSEGATAEEIKAAYHRLAKQWHPDRFSGEAKAEAESRFRQLAEAFSMLKDVARRAPVPVPASSAVPSAPVQDQPVRIDLQTEPTPRERNAEDWYQEAKAAFDHGDPQKALGLSHFAIRMDGNKGEYHALLAKAIAQTSGDAKAESRALEMAIQLNPKDLESTIRLAELFQSVGMHARATRLWEVARRLDPNNPLFVKPAPAKDAKKVDNLKASLADQWADLKTQWTLLVDRLKPRSKS